MIFDTALRTIVSVDAPCQSAGYSIAPTPTMHPCPSIRRGIEWLVPIVPGFVNETVVPAKSVTSSLPPRARRTTSS